MRVQPTIRDKTLVQRERECKCTLQSKKKYHPDYILGFEMPILGNVDLVLFFYRHAVTADSNDRAKIKANW